MSILVGGAGFVWKNPIWFSPASLIRINPPGKSQKNPLEGGFFLEQLKNDSLIAPATSTTQNFI